MDGLIITGFVIGYLLIAFGMYRYLEYCKVYYEVYKKQVKNNNSLPYNKLIYKHGENYRDEDEHGFIFAFFIIYWIIGIPIYLVLTLLAWIGKLIVPDKSLLKARLENKRKQKQEKMLKEQAKEQMIEDEIQRIKIEFQQGELKTQLFTEQEYRKMAIDNLNEFLD